MSETFNLIDEPWIEVVDHDGKESIISIRDLLDKAENYRDLSHALGTVNFATLRVILAILYRSWDSKNLRKLDNALDHWEQKWQQESLLDTEVQKYLDTWHHRFDLRDEKMPFFQVPDLHTAKNEWKKLDILLPDIGDDGDLFTMRAGISSISVAEAAQMVVHVMAYDYSGIKSGAVGDPRVKGGRGYPIGIGWAGWLGGTLLKGANLKETLLLNYVPQREEAGTDDLPQWELPPLGPGPRLEPMYNLDSPERNGATGLVELLTWPQRRVRLRWKDDRVDAVIVANGDRVGYTTKFGIETMTPWRYSDPQTKKAKQLVYMPQELDSGRAMWRSVGNILPNSTVERKQSKFADNAPTSVTAINVQWLGKLVNEGVIPGDKMVTLHMVSMTYGAQSSSFSGIVQDSLVLKAPFFDSQDERFRAAAREAVGQTDETAKMLGTFYRDVIFAVSGEKQVNTDEIRGRFYDLVDAPFREWLRGVPDVEDPAEKLGQWGQVLKSKARGLAREILSEQGPNVWTGRWNGDRNVRVTGANAELWLNSKLRKLLDSVVDKQDDNS